VSARFLLDMNLPRSLVRLLVNDGHAARHVADLGLDRAADAEIVEVARAADEIILTHDLDFGQLLAFSGESRPSVIIFRFERANAATIREKLVTIWPLMNGPLSEGAMVVVRDDALRVRRLPLR